MLDTLFVVLSYLANTDDSVEFAVTWLVETYGDIFAELSYKNIRKSAKKAIRRINGKTLSEADIKAIEYHFLMKLDVAGFVGKVRQFEDRVYIFEEDHKWHFDHLINPACQ